MPFRECPLCGKRYPEAFIAVHAASCGSSPSVKRRRVDPPTRVSTNVYRSAPPKSGPPSEIGAPGFHLFPHVFSDIEEHLLRHILAAPPQWIDYRFRKAKNYGPPYSLRERRFLFGSSAPHQVPIPPFVHDSVLPRLRRLPMLSRFAPNQLTVAEYLVPGSRILPHNDCETGIIHTAVVGVCLGARCSMTLILRARYTGLGKDVKKDVVLPPGAVYIMSGDALRVWEHAIFSRNIDATRYSLTFRDVSPAISGSSKAEIKAEAPEAHKGQRSPKAKVGRERTDGHVPTANTMDKTATQLGVKKRRLVQQRFT